MGLGPNGVPYGDWFTCSQIVEQRPELFLNTDWYHLSEWGIPIQDMSFMVVEVVGDCGLLVILAVVVFIK